MANATIRVKNVATVRIHVEVGDLNGDGEFEFDLDPQEESGPITLEPHPENLDYQIEWTATAEDCEPDDGDPYVEDGEVVDVTVGAPIPAPAKP